MSEDLVKQPIVWITSDDTLDEVCQKWEEKKLLAIDTEFIRTQTYYPIAGLIQVNDGDQNYLIDPTKISDYYPLVEILDNDDIVKVLHSGSEDLEVFHHTVGCTPKQIFDTQIAGAFCGFGFSVGFANMVKLALDVELPKTETRSDWLARPLSQAQVYYAALDVEYLYTLAEKLLVLLKESERIDWVFEECSALVKRHFDNQDPRNAYNRFKNGWRLTERQLQVLVNLAQWRENASQDRDIPRNRLIKEHALMEIAAMMPEHIAQLRDVEGLAERSIRRDGSKIIDLVSEAQEVEESALPARMPKPLGSDSKKLVKQIRELVATTAEKYDLPVEMLLKRKDLESLVREYDMASNTEVMLPENLQGWREDIVGEALQQFFRG